MSVRRRLGFDTEVVNERLPLDLETLTGQLIAIIAGWLLFTFTLAFWLTLFLP